MRGFADDLAVFLNYLLEVSFNQRTAIISFVARVPIKSVRIFFLRC